MCSERQVRGIPSSWHRLQRIAEDRGTTALVFTPMPIMSGVSLSLRLTKRFGLPSLDLLRDEIAADLQLETLRTRSHPHTAVDRWEATTGVLSA